MHFISARNALKWNSFKDFTKTNLCNSLFIFTSRSDGRWMNSVRLGIERWIAAVAVLKHFDFYLEVRSLYCHVIRFAINIYQKRKCDCLNYPKNMLWFIRKLYSDRTKVEKSFHFRVDSSCLFQAAFTAGSQKPMSPYILYMPAL